MVGGNLLEASPDRAWTTQAFDRIATKIYLTTTLNRGHLLSKDSGEVIILPVCARDEEPEPTTQESMFNYVRLSDGGIQRIASVRSESTILADIGTKLLKHLPFDFEEFRGHQKIRQAISRVIPGMEDLADIDVAKREFHVRGRVLHSPDFKTPDKKANFVSVNATADDTQTSDFMLMSIRSEGQFNSIIYEEKDSYRGVDNRWTVLLNLQDALELGVSNGDLVDLTSSQGCMSKVTVQIFNIARGCAAAYYPEANVLTSRTSDPRSHTPAFKSIPIAIARS